jgi:hypothetical protein
MLRRLWSILRSRSRSEESRAPRDLLTLDRSEIGSFLSTREGLPRIDWGAVDTWISRRGAEAAPTALRRAAAAAWLDELRDALEEDHRRWRHARIEGLGPVADGTAIAMSRIADQGILTIEQALTPIRGSAPVEAVAIVGLAGTESYYSLISDYYPDEGEWGTSGGVYLNEGSDCFPVIAFPTAVKRGIPRTIAHELTHHALRGVDLPLWAEEGLTQMMEERVTGVPNFRLDRDMLRRHRDRWLDGAIDRFVSGDAFQSPEEDEQELAYHLSQLVVRGWLTRDPQRFFAFSRACRRDGHETAAAEHLGMSAEQAVEHALNVPG